MRNKYNQVAVVTATILFTSFTFAANSSGEQDLETFSDPSNVGGDPGASPINYYLIPMLIVVFVLGYWLLQTKKKINS